MPPKSSPDMQTVEAPAKLGPRHIQDRAFRNDAGQIVTNTAAWRERTHLESYYHREMLNGGNPKHNQETRLQAGQYYATLCDTWRPSGRDSTQALNISRSTGGGNGRDAAADAGRKIACIHSHMGERDRLICTKVMGDGYSPSEAVMVVCFDYKDTVSARFREALDSLAIALDTARKSGWLVFNMEVRP